VASGCVTHRVRSSVPRTYWRMLIWYTPVMALSVFV